MERKSKKFARFIIKIFYTTKKNEDGEISIIDIALFPKKKRQN